MKPLVCSFSGGRTSAYMTYHLIQQYKNQREIIVLFANTGQEHPKTLEFVNNCDKEFGFNTIWLESVVHHNQRKSNTHKIVTYETASKDKNLFEEMILKHGIPNKAFPHCTRELKLAPIYSYIKSIGFKLKNIEMAIGIRSDEQRRVRKDATQAGIIYPLVYGNIDKQDVLDWWDNQTFDLKIEEHEGNCLWCWKKTDKKHFRNMQKNPQWYDVPKYFEEKYPHVGAHKDKTIPRTFFRQNRSTKVMFKLYQESIGNLLPIDDKEIGGCSESCELFEMELIK